MALQRNRKNPGNNKMISMQVTKRDGTLEEVSFDKVLTRIRKAADGLEVDPVLISQRVVTRIYQGVKTSELDELTSNLSISLVTTNPDYGILAARIAIGNHQKNTPATWLDAVETLTTNPKHNLAPAYVAFVKRWGAQLENTIDYKRDFMLDYFGFKTLELQHYLMRTTNGRVVERPQHLWMRVAASLWLDKVPDDATPDHPVLLQIKQTYELLSTKQYIHATPTNFNTGTTRPQLSSCFLLSMKEDSISGIYDTLKDCAQISKHAGGIGLHIHNVRAKGSHIAGTNGTSNGIVPMLRNFNMTARYVDQGGGKRNGSFAIYLEPWHADIEDFLKLKTPQGAEEERARDLFYALWVPDLFMERVEQDGEWTLMCPHQCPGLADCHGDEFRRLYEQYESEGRGRKVSAQKLWFKILDSQIETGTPYILYKDAANAKSNQQNLGTIKSSNLCTEIIEYSSPDESAVCNLASLSLPAFVRGGATSQKSFDFARLRSVVAMAVKNLNRVIDINYYPTPETLKSNMRHRPIGLGVQGLADVFAILRIPWETEKAATLNQRIAEHIYYAAVETSAIIAKDEGTYETYMGSPASRGQLQPDMWGVEPITQKDATLDWAALRALVAQYGLRNSLLIAPMPTASTSQILGNTECFEPVLSNIFTRRTLSGEYIIINKHLMADLRRYGVWSEALKQKIIAQNGSVQGLDEVPDAVQKLYKTAWEIKQRTLIDMAADRGAFICQSQSLNLFVADPTYAKLTSMHFYSWKKGLKTGIYYLRTRAPVMAQKFTVDPEILAEAQRSEQERLHKSAEPEEGCLVCSA